MTAAKSQIGISYVLNGGGLKGPTMGGFDCSGLTQYAVFKGTGKIISRQTPEQYIEKKCRALPYADRMTGDLVFFSHEGKVDDVGIITGPKTMIHAPHVKGEKIAEIAIYSEDIMPKVQRCW